MVRRPLASLVLWGVCAFAVAQEPEPLDLAAIASRLDVGELPSVLGVLPAAEQQELARLGDLLPAEDVEPMLRFGQGKARVAAAVRVFRQTATERATAAGALREILACNALVSVSQGSRALQSMAGTETASWLAGAADAARVRGRGLGARLLRDHPDDPSTGVCLLLAAGELRDLEVARLVSDARRRLGQRANAGDLGALAMTAFRGRDFDRATALLDAADAAPRPATLAERCADATRRFDLRQRLGLARGLAARTGGDDLDAEIARLRLLQLTDADAAFAAAQRLADAGAEHSLPWSMLAARMVRGGTDDPGPLLVRAVQSPGADDQTVAAMLICRVLPLVRELRASPARRDGLESDLEAVLARADTILADLDTEPARILRWLRKEWSFPSGAGDAIPRSLSAANALRGALPGSRDACLLALVAAAAAANEEAAVALRAPLPEALAGLPELALLRASLFVRWHLAHEGALAAGDVDAVMGDLERAQADPRDAAYLRGVLQWAQAVRKGAGADELRAARDLFAKAQRGMADPGWWRAACALTIANAALGEEAGLEDLLERRTFRDTADDHVGVSLLAAISIARDVPPEALDAVQRVVTATDSDRELAVLHAATAAGRRARGDAAGARKSAQLALAAIDRMGPPDPPYDRGVVCDSEFHWNFGLSGARLALELAARCPLWVVPPLPDRAALEAIAEGR